MSLKQEALLLKTVNGHKVTAFWKKPPIQYIDKLLYNSGRYTGSVINNSIPDGTGKLVYDDKSYIEGSWKNGKPDGNMMYVMISNTYKTVTFTGTIVQRSRFYHPVKGKIVYFTKELPAADESPKATGIGEIGTETIIEGDFQKKNNIKITYPDGSIFTGKVQNEIENYKRSEGALKLTDGTTIKGRWGQNGSPVDVMEVTYPNGYAYTGAGRYDSKFKRHGQGTLTLREGTTIKGEWRNDLPEANIMNVKYGRKGIYTMSDESTYPTGAIYTGTLTNDGTFKRNGRGTLSWGYFRKTVVEGDWVDGYLQESTNAI